MRFAAPTDHNAHETRVAMLTVFAQADYPLTRRQAEERAWGKTGYTATWAVRALRWLLERGFIESAYDPQYGTGARRFRCTDVGRLHLAGVEAFRGEAS